MPSDEKPQTVVLRVVLTVEELRLIDEYLYCRDWLRIPGDVDDALEKIRRPISDFVDKL